MASKVDALTIIHFISAVSGSLASTYVLGLLVFVKGEEWHIPGLFAFGAWLETITWSSGWYWDFDTYRYPAGFCKASAILFNFGAFCLTSCGCTLTITTWNAVHQARQGRFDRMSRPWQIPDWLKFFWLLYPFIGVLVFATLGLYFDAFGPEGRWICDVTRPGYMWIRLFGYGGIDVLVTVPAFCASLLSIRGLWVIHNDSTLKSAMSTFHRAPVGLTGDDLDLSSPPPTRTRRAVDNDDRIDHDLMWIRTPRKASVAPSESEPPTPSAPTVPSTGPSAPASLADYRIVEPMPAERSAPARPPQPLSPSALLRSENGVQSIQYVAYHHQPTPAGKHDRKWMRNRSGSSVVDENLGVMGREEEKAKANRSTDGGESGLVTSAVGQAKTTISVAGKTLAAIRAQPVLLRALYRIMFFDVMFTVIEALAAITSLHAIVTGVPPQNYSTCFVAIVLGIWAPAVVFGSTPFCLDRICPAWRKAQSWVEARL